MQLYIILYIDKHTIIYNIQTYQLYRCLWLHNATYDRIFYIYYNITYVIPFIKKIIYICVYGYLVPKEAERVLSALEMEFLAVGSCHEGVQNQIQVCCKSSRYFSH